jgi:hypothetical protein
VGGRYSEDQKHGHVGLQVRIEALIEQMGLKDRVEYNNLMAPQWKIDFPDADLQQKVFDDLGRARNVSRNVPVFSFYKEGNSICLSVMRNQEMEDTLEIPTVEGMRRLTAKDLLIKHSEVVKSGRHHPKGVLMMNGPSVGSGVSIERCDNLDIAPTLMTLLGLEIPKAMKGRVLDEAFSPVHRVQAAV